MDNLMHSEYKKGMPLELRRKATQQRIVDELFAKNPPKQQRLK
jgi:hypothetical protein